MAEPDPHHHEPDLHHHGDRELGPGLVDLAVNVRPAAPPPWLREVLTTGLESLAAYPDPTAAVAAVAARHTRPDSEVLLTAGGAEAFTLVARAWAPGTGVRRPVVVHPQFTEPEAALLAAGHRVERVLLRAGDGFVLDPAAVPGDADLVVVGNPTNPTSVLHPAATLRAIARPGRLLVVDEAFMDAVPGEPATLSGPAGRGVPGLVVVRSLTKTWGLAGLRAGYVLADAGLVRALARVQPPWSVSSLALLAARACCRPEGVAEAARGAGRLVADTAYLLERLQAAGLGVVTPPRAPFVLARAPGGGGLRMALRGEGFAVRRGESFPGLGTDWLRIAARDRPTTDAFVDALVRAGVPA